MDVNNDSLFYFTLSTCLGLQLARREQMRALRGFWRLFGLSPSEEKAVVGQVDHSPRQCLAVRKRISRFTRLLLAILPRRVQGALGYPVCTSIGCSLSPGTGGVRPLQCSFLRRIQHKLKSFNVIHEFRVQGN